MGGLALCILLYSYLVRCPKIKSCPRASKVAVDAFLVSFVVMESRQVPGNANHRMAVSSMVGRRCRGCKTNAANLRLSGSEHPSPLRWRMSIRVSSLCARMQREAMRRVGNSDLSSAVN